MIALHVRITVHMRINVHVRLVAFHVGFIGAVVATLRLDRSTMVMVVVTLQAGYHTHCHRSSHYRVGTHQHQRPSKTRHLFWLILPRPRPRCAHDDVALQQQHSDTRSPHRFRLTRGRPHRRPRDAGHDP